MATIDLTNAGLRGSFRVGGARSRTFSASGLPMTPMPAVTPASVSAAMQPEFAALQALLAAVPSEVWAAATRTLTSAAPPTAEAIATAVRADQSVELARIDVSLSTRLAAADYVEPSTAPSADDVATAVREELAPDGLVTVDVRAVNGYSVSGEGTELNPWGPG